MSEMRADFATVEEAVEDFRQGRMIVLVDDEDRENEGDLAMAAEKATPEAINFMARFGRGLICLALSEQRCEELHLPLMSPINTSAHGTAFCEAIDARLGEFRMIAYASDVDRDQHIALVRGDLDAAEAPLVRVHSHCLTGDVLGSTACDCHDIIARSLEAIAAAGRGVFLYLHHTGRG